MAIKILKVFESIKPNPDYKTVITVEKPEDSDHIFFITTCDYERNFKGKKLWKQKGNWSDIYLDKKALKEFGKFLIECGG